jgi:hypothetical protein
MVYINPSGSALATVISPYIITRAFRAAQFSVLKEEAGGFFEASNDSHGVTSAFFSENEFYDLWLRRY